MTVFYSDFYSTDVTDASRPHTANPCFAGSGSRLKVSGVGIDYTPPTASYTYTGLPYSISDRIPEAGDIIALDTLYSDWAINDGLLMIDDPAGGADQDITFSLGLWRCNTHGKPTQEIQKDCFMHENNTTSGYSYIYNWPRDTAPETLNVADLQYQLWDLPLPALVGPPLVHGLIEKVALVLYFNAVASWTIGEGSQFLSQIRYTQAG